jgi:hypothetical protein
VQMAGADRSQDDAAGLLDVHYTAACEVALQGTRSLLLDLSPRAVRDSSSRCRLFIVFHPFIHLGVLF